MTASAHSGRRVLLSSVIKPFGVDDVYGRKENILELMHNQISQFEGVFSIRHRFPSIGLHLIAANLDGGATVLDYPTESRFIAELKRGYDVVGISSIMPNFLKAKRMCELCRIHAPSATVVVGGFLALMDQVDQMIDADHFCQGEGIRFMRNLLGEPPEFEMRHPHLTLDLVEYMGIPVDLFLAMLQPTIGLDPTNFRWHFIATGLGCTKACEFCSTSYFFDCKHVPFMRTGREIYEVMDRKARATGIRSFAFIGDDNFFLDRRRVEDLWKLQREHGQDYRITLSFGSIDLLSQFDPEMLSEAGFDLIWIGVESRLHPFPKNRRADPATVIAGLHRYGIKTILSSILFFDEHTPENIQEDIDYHLSLSPTFSQFSGLSPVDGTPLYDRLVEQGRILHHLPPEDCHAFKQIWFSHPRFSLMDSERIQRQAYERDFIELGPGVIRFKMVAARALAQLEASSSPVLRQRARLWRAELTSAKASTLASIPLAKNQRQRQVIRGYLDELCEIGGPLTTVERAKAAVYFAAAASRVARTFVVDDVIQPRTALIKYQGGRAARVWPD